MQTLLQQTPLQPQKAECRPLFLGAPSLPQAEREESLLMKAMRFAQEAKLSRGAEVIEKVKRAAA